MRISRDWFVLVADLFEHLGLLIRVKWLRWRLARAVARAKRRKGDNE